MKQTISIRLENRFNDVEKIINLLTSTGFKTKKMVLSERDEKLSDFTIVVETGNKDISNMLIRLRQLIRVKSLECAEGDNLKNLIYSTEVQ